jgi:hypothetical protein
MPAHHDLFIGKVALAVRAPYVSGSLLAEGNEGTRRECCVPSRRVRDAHRVALGASRIESIQG